MSEAFQGDGRGVWECEGVGVWSEERGRKTGPDPALAVLIAMLVVGLALILATVGVVSARRQDRQQGEAGRLFVRVLPVVQTRDAQQVVIASLEADLQRASRELDALRGQVASLAATATAQPPAAMWGKPPRALILDVPAYKQTRSLSCESSAAAMAANFHGIQVSEAEIQAALPRHPDPSLGFRGDVDGPYGGIDDYGVYAEPVRQVLVGLGLEVSHFSEATKVATTVDEIRQHIRQGRVVMAWVTYDMQEQSPVQIWFDDRQPVTLVPYEHVVLVVGYNDDGLWVNDPYTGTTRFYLEAAFARSFAYLGNMGLVVGPPRDG